MPAPLILMNRLPLLRAALAIFIASGFPSEAVLENRLDSLGPLKRYDPYAEAPQFLVKIHGKPQLGLPSEAGERLQRVSDKNWFLELGDRVARMEPDFKTGEVLLKEVIHAAEQWCVSPDGKWMFAGRKTEKHKVVSECFDLSTGESKWTFEKSLNTMGVCFTPDGKQVAILHKSPNPPPKIPPNVDPRSLDSDSFRKLVPPVSAAVSWYDANSGELVRRVEIPGSSGGSKGAFLAFSGDRLYVARPGNDGGGECFVIKPGIAEPEKIEVEALGGEEEPCVEVGGVHGEFGAFYSDDHVVLFRQEAGGHLTRLKELELERSSEGNSYTWCARFTPDGKQLVLSSCWKAIFISTGGSAGTENQEFLPSSHLGTFHLTENFSSPSTTAADGFAISRHGKWWRVLNRRSTRRTAARSRISPGTKGRRFPEIEVVNHSSAGSAA